MQKKKIKTYINGLEYPLEEIPVFHQICKELKLRNNFNNINLSSLFPYDPPGLLPQQEHIIRNNALRELVLKGEITEYIFKDFMISYVKDNVNNDGTIKTWEAGPDIPNTNNSKNDILNIIEAGIDFTSLRGAAKRVIKILKD